MDRLLINSTYKKIKKDFLYHFNQSIKIEQGNSIFYLYDKDLILKYKLSQINNTEFKIPENIKWKDNIVLFEQDIKTKEFWIKYNRYWKKFETKYSLNWLQYKNIIENILDNNTVCKQYTLALFKTH